MQYPGNSAAAAAAASSYSQYGYPYPYAAAGPYSALYSSLYPGMYPPMGGAAATGGAPGASPATASSSTDYPTCYVSRLGQIVDETALYKLFGPFGAVVDAKVMRNADGTARGFGFVKMVNYADAERAITSLNGTAPFGEPIYVAFKKAKQ